MEVCLPFQTFSLSWLRNQMEWDSDSNLIGGDAVADDGWFGGDSGPVPFPANSLPGMTPSGFVVSDALPFCRS